MKYYSDNKAVIQFIKDQSILVFSYKRGRIEKIIDLSDKEQRHYVCSKENPADMLTKSPSLAKLKEWFSWPKEKANIMTRKRRRGKKATTSTRKH